MVDVIGTKVYKDGEQIIAQVQFLSSFRFSFPIGNNYHVIYRQCVLLNYDFSLSNKTKTILHLREVIILFQKLIFHLRYFEKHPSVGMNKGVNIFSILRNSNYIKE